MLFKYLKVDPPMTAIVRQLLDSFDRLSVADQHEAAIEILRRSLPINFPPLDDQTLIQSAEELFLNLDAQEAAGESAAAL
jgi:hypothetical protein